MGTKTKGLKLKAHRLTKISETDRKFMVSAINRAANDLKAVKRGDLSAMDSALTHLEMIERTVRSYKRSIISYKMPFGFR
jgi:hypothetical protein